MSYLAFVLDDASRARLLQAVPARFPKVIAHHVTMIFPKQPKDAALLEQMLKYHTANLPEVHAVCHYQGPDIHAVGVTFNGLRKRPDGSFYHVTVSLRPPAKPADSNKLSNPTEISHFALTGSVQLLP